MCVRLFLGGLTVPMQLLEIAVIPRANVVVIGVVSLAGSRVEGSSDGAADGAAVAVDPLAKREQLVRRPCRVLKLAPAIF